MQKTKMTILATLAAALLVASVADAQIGPVDNRQAAIAGADRLLEVQFESGAFPWITGQPGEFVNVQGITAVALLDAYTLTLDARYLEGATANRDWHADLLESSATARVSAPSFYFLAKYALLTQEAGDVELANEAFDRSLDFYGGATALAEFVLQFRGNSVHTNMGVWDVALFVRGAHDIGRTNESAELAAVLAAQTEEGGIVDAFDPGANWYELGLSGLLFGLSEADHVGYLDIILEARGRLLAQQCDDGSFAVMWQGDRFCGEVQNTAFAVLGITHSLGPVHSAQAGCDALRAAQGENGGWDLGGYEIAEIDSESVQALVACVLPLHNGATSYANGLVAGI